MPKQTAPATAAEEEELVYDADGVEEARNLPAVVQHEAIVAQGEITVGDVVAQRDKILAVQQAVMREGVHFGKIPGIKKPSLFKPGAEVLCTTFRLAPSYERTIEWLDRGDGQRHMIVESNCTLTHATSGTVLGSAGGMCATLESKYAYRQADKVCLDCGMPLRRSKQRDSKPPEWYCWAKQGGCGKTFPLDDPSIVAQVEGRVDNPDIADVYNTVLKMADKRGLVAAILVCTAASEVFTQDVEDNAATAVAGATPGAAAAAAGDPRTKMRLDIQDLWRKLDRKRKVEGGTTFADSMTVLAQWYGDDEQPEFDSLTEEQLIRLGTSLGGYWTYLQQTFQADVVPHNFAGWVNSEEVPF